MKGDTTTARCVAALIENLRAEAGYRISETDYHARDEARYWYDRLDEELATARDLLDVEEKANIIVKGRTAGVERIARAIEEVYYEEAVTARTPEDALRCAALSRARATWALSDSDRKAWIGRANAWVDQPEKMLKAAS